MTIDSIWKDLTVAMITRNGERFGLQVQFSFDGPQLLGTAGALKKAMLLLGESFFVLFGLEAYAPTDNVSN